jgi:hypothetical protein
VTPFAAIVGGGGAGFLGAALAHVLTTAADRLGSEAWLRGPYGPQFFNVALYTGAFYAAIGAAAGKPGRGRAWGALLGFLGPFLGIALTMAVLSHYAGWGMPRGTHAGTPQWEWAVILIYTLSIWGTIAALGALAGRAARWRGAVAAVLGSLAGYGVLAALLRLFPAYGRSPWNPLSFIPSPVNLTDGLLSGAGLCLALALDELWKRRTS